MTEEIKKYSIWYYCYNCDKQFQTFFEKGTRASMPDKCPLCGCSPERSLSYGEGY